jgi:hypothetical protein
MIDPYDSEKLREEIKALKRELNLVKDDNKLLLSKNEQYKKRANYAKTKYYEIKH